MKKTIFVLSFLFLFSCEDRLYKEKYDIEFLITNKTATVISELKIDGDYGTKVWIIKNIEPGKIERLKLNIKRDLRIPEGGFMITALLARGDTLSLNTGYFTNWSYQGPNPSRFNVYEDRIVLEE
ncbi:hypothetical protein [Dyadobacter arcticus]|uniref:Lipoprotein n=1 Tax=Dyadobacter arcticus TaxID=1078754 RepID=A0ABX0UQI9_9BACT|nr:hypothetical protein [Dyadobacter arcticus]NIJ53271.1 hypothetical protein [Dyadobacter arcticus]